MTEVRLIVKDKAGGGLDAKIGGLTPEQAGRVIKAFHEVFAERFPKRSA